MTGNLKTAIDWIFMAEQNEATGLQVASRLRLPWRLGHSASGGVSPAVIGNEDAAPLAMHASATFLPSIAVMFQR